MADETNKISDPEITDNAVKTNINEKFKDRLFKFIFGNPEHKDWTLSLYNAVNGSSYTNPDDIEFNTIEDVLYMGMKNDVSFIVMGTVNFYEQQSTYNPNLPLRFLLYAGKAYERIIEFLEINVYSSTLQNIPTPRCICFYNGERNTNDVQVLKLSDAFAFKTDKDDPSIEVKVTMYNINYGHNKELLEACKPLMEYSWFVEEVRQNKKNGNDLDTAVDTALNNMPDDFVIKQFLRNNRAEVKGMFLTEYDEQKVMNAFKKEGFIEGKTIGKVEGIEEGKLRTLYDLEKGRVITHEEAVKASTLTDREYSARTALFG